MHFNFFRRILSLLVVVGVFSLSMSTSFAQSNNNVYLPSSNSINNQGAAHSPMAKLNPKPSIVPIGAVLVFVSGVVVGYVVDGVFIYKTGHSAGELTATAIKKIVAYAKLHLGVGSVYYKRSTGTVGSGGGGGGGW